MENILLTLAIGQIANLIAWSFYPLQLLKDKLNIKNEVLNTLINCPNCIAFWVALPFFYKQWVLIFISMLAAQLIEKLFR